MVNQTPQRVRAPRLRIVAAASIAALLLGSSFYAAQAGGGNNAGYGDSLNGGEITAIALGGAAGIAIVMGVMNNKEGDDEASAAKSKSAKAVDQLRVVPSQSRLGAGDSATVEVQARYTGSSTWENVTNAASVRLVSGELTAVDGSKNAFAVPYGSKLSSGNATISASFGGQNASTTVAVN